MNETMEGIMDTVAQMRKTDKIKLVNLILASITSPSPSSKEGREGESVPMPVYEGLHVFAEIYQQKKGVSYAPNGKFSAADFKNMRELLVKIGDRIAESGTYRTDGTDRTLVTDKMRLDNLRGFLEAVCAMKNQWYYDKRFNPYGLNNDFNDIYTQLVNNSDNARRKAAFDYL